MCVPPTRKCIYIYYNECTVCPGVCIIMYMSTYYGDVLCTCTYLRVCMCVHLIVEFVCFQNVQVCVCACPRDCVCA